MQIGKIELSTSSVLLKTGLHWANSDKISVADTKMMAPTKDSHSPVCWFLGGEIRKTVTVKPISSSMVQN